MKQRWPAIDATDLPGGVAGGESSRRLGASDELPPDNRSRAGVCAGTGSGTARSLWFRPFQILANLFLIALPTSAASQAPQYRAILDDHPARHGSAHALSGAYASAPTTWMDLGMAAFTAAHLIDAQRHSEDVRLSGYDVNTALSGKNVRPNLDIDQKTFLFSEQFLPTGQWIFLRQERYLRSIHGIWFVRDDRLCVIPDGGNEVCREVWFHARTGGIMMMEFDHISESMIIMLITDIVQL